MATLSQICLDKHRIWGSAFLICMNKTSLEGNIWVASPLEDNYWEEYREKSVGVDKYREEWYRVDKYMEWYRVEAEAEAE